MIMCLLIVTLRHIKINWYLCADKPWTIEMQCDTADSTKADASWNALHQTNQVATPLLHFTTDKTCDMINVINNRSTHTRYQPGKKMFKQLDQEQAPPLLQKMN